MFYFTEAFNQRFRIECETEQQAKEETIKLVLQRIGSHASMEQIKIIRKES